MANQTIPITLQAGTPLPDEKAINLTQLLQMIVKYIAGSIRADVSFFLEVLADPANFITNLVFNSNQRVWKAWDQTAGVYVPLTQYRIGQVIPNFSGADDVALGWVTLDGRAFTSIPGLSATQLAVLQNMFGGTTLPVVTPTNTVNLPAAATFSGIVKPPILPANDVIGALPIGGTYDQTEVVALRDDTEILRDSAQSLSDQVGQIQDKCSDLLTALRSSSVPTLYAQVFVGFA